MVVFPAVTTFSLFSSPQSGYYTSYSLLGPNRREFTCNFIDSNAMVGARCKGGMTNSVVADIVVPLSLTTIIIRIEYAPVFNV
jgi:hypothetical protein